MNITTNETKIKERKKKTNKLPSILTTKIISIYTTKCCFFQLIAYTGTQEIVLVETSKHSHSLTKCIVFWFVFVFFNVVACFIVVVFFILLFLFRYYCCCCRRHLLLCHYIIIISFVWLLFSQITYAVAVKVENFYSVQQTWTFMHNKLKMSRQNMLLKIHTSNNLRNYAQW